MKKNQNRGNRFWQKLGCLLIILGMLLCLVACNLASELEGLGILDTTASTTKNPTKNTTKGTTSTSGGEKNQILDLEYELTQAEVDAYYDLLEELEAVSLVGEDLDAIDALTAAFEESFAYLDAQCSIAAVYHYSHTLDEELEAQYLDCVDICTEANDAYIQMVKRVYLSDSPAKDYLFEGWTEQEIAQLLAYNPQIAQLQQRNAEISVEYRTTDDDAQKISLYIEMVNNNNAIAQIYGYDNYYTFAYQNVYGRDYGMEEVDTLRQYASECLAELYLPAMMNFYSAYSGLSSKNQRILENFLYSDYDSLDKNYLQSYVDTLDGAMGTAIADMLAYDSYFTKASDALEGAFTTTIGDRCFCFFGPGYANAMTVLHEGGHYYAGCYTDLDAIPMDLAELHSQGNEWLFTSYLKTEMNGKIYDALVNYKMYENIGMILVCLMVDEFEQQVYTTDLTGYTAADLDAMMYRITLRYFPNGDCKDRLADMKAYWRLVVVEQPVYYISYAVSGIASISLYTMAEENYSHAMDVYQALCENVDLEAGFLGNIEAAGLLSPFQRTFYTKLSQIIKGYSKQ